MGRLGLESPLLLILFGKRCLRLIEQSAAARRATTAWSRRTTDAARGIGRSERDGIARHMRRCECERAARAGRSCARKPETGSREYGLSASMSGTGHVWDAWARGGVGRTRADPVREALP